MDAAINELKRKGAEDFHLSGNDLRVFLAKCSIWVGDPDEDGFKTVEGGHV